MYEVEARAVSGSGVLRASGLNASGWKTGDDVGSEKASWVEEKTWPFLEES